MSRLEQLESMLADEPNDTFLRYALAMELANDDQLERCLELYQGLMKDDPPYVPAFFMCGQKLAQLDRLAEAQSVLSDGITQAQNQNDLHAAGEMSEFLAEISQSG